MEIQLFKSRLRVVEGVQLKNGIITTAVLICKPHICCTKDPSTKSNIPLSSYHCPYDVGKTAETARVYYGL